MGNVSVQSVDGIAGLVTKVLEIGAGKDQLWFRGVSSSDYSLVPKAFRAPSPWSLEDLEAEVSTAGRDFLQDTEPALIKRFKQRALPFLQGSHASSTNASMMVYMQHYGAPTRLLDWTENLMVAAYFAVEGAGFESANDTSRKPAIWILNPKRWNEKVNAGSGMAGGIPTFDSISTDSKANNSDLYPWLPTEEIGDNVTRKKHNALAVYAMYGNDRIQAQQGVFTVAGSSMKGLELQAEDFPSDDSPLLYKLIYEPGGSKMKDELYRLGYRKSMLYPGLESICAELTYGMSGGRV